MGQDPDVLPGPKAPMWGCPSCGRNSNFASRIKCLCGKKAPQAIIDKAKKAAAELQSGPHGKPPRAPGGAWARGPPHDAPNPVVRSISALQKQMESLVK
eukprot:2937191-Pyramimonas_sp.AAC.1